MNKSICKLILEQIEIKTIDDAIEFVKKAHEGQVDKGGRVYYEHPLDVANRAKVSNDGKIAALLHDVLEDTSYTEQDLREYGVSERVINLIKLLTRNKNETYAEFIGRIIASGDQEAIKIKIADNESNSSPERELPESERGILRRYEKSLARLRKALDV